MVSPEVRAGHWQARAERSEREWLEWLVRIGYGVDWFQAGDAPPCSALELGEAYARMADDGDSAEDYENTILHMTGAFNREASK